MFFGGNRMGPTFFSDHELNAEEKKWTKLLSPARQSHQQKICASHHKKKNADHKIFIIVIISDITNWFHHLTWNSATYHLQRFRTKRHFN